MFLASDWTRLGHDGAEVEARCAQLNSSDYDEHVYIYNVHIPRTHLTSVFDRKRPYFEWLVVRLNQANQHPTHREPTLEKPAAAMSSSESSSESTSDSSYSSTNGESGESVDGAENYKLAKQEMTLGSSTKDDS